VCWKGLFGSRQVQALDGMPQMRNYDAPTDHQRNIESFVQFLILPADLYALQDVVINAIVAA